MSSATKRQPLSEIELIEGHTAILKYKLSSSRFPVRFLKDNQFIAETTNIRKRVIGRSKTLEFTYVAPSDSGKYCLEVAGKQSSLTELKIQLYAKYIEVKWSKEKQQLYDCAKVKINSIQTQRMLTIEKLTLADSGKYYVKAGNVEMEIPVTVKGSFIINNGNST
ncbi:unnamed protein product [Mytilus edulis]|uniref:Immunoglobulin I-set domain-containing protein n=1 Tax=Mytilus edulis TaxID=6550 RepID=A0A8S3QXA7_MYTED|nr:unnamed protein product [Mytilus edulis]